MRARRALLGTLLALGMALGPAAEAAEPVRAVLEPASAEQCPARVGGAPAGS